MLKGLPPDMVYFPEREARLGLSIKEARKILADRRQQRYTTDILAMLGDQRVSVGPFCISRHEVTNAQYLQFLEATGHRFPFHWWQRANREQVYEEWARKHPKVPFDPVEHWVNFWEKLEWAVPPGQEDWPVEWVCYRDALAYCTWAGMRLPTEPEWIYAARKDETYLYPWGDEWPGKPKDPRDFARVMRGEPVPVTRNMPRFEPKTGLDILHLAGNVFELTSSRFRKILGWESYYRRMADYGGLDNAQLPRWAPDLVIAKGGSYNCGANARIACMIDYRGPIATTNAFQGCGFRTCKSLWPGLDSFRSALDVKMQGGILGSSKVEVEDAESTNFLGIESYEIKEGKETCNYHSVGFAPTINGSKKIKNRRDFESASLERPLPIGVLMTTEKLTDPEIDAGLYVIYFRDKGVANSVKKELRRRKLEEMRRRRSGEKKEEDQEPLSEDWVMLGDLKVPTKDMHYLVRNAQTGKWLQHFRTTRGPLVKNRNSRSIMETRPAEDSIFFRSPVMIKSRSSALQFTLPLRLAKGTMEKRSWRYPPQDGPNRYMWKRNWAPRARLETERRSTFGGGGERRLASPR